MELHEIPKDINWRRRLITTSLWYFLAVTLTILLAPLLLLTGLYDLVTRNRLSTCRTLIFFNYFFVLESTGLLVALWLWFRHHCGLSDEDYEHKNRKLQRWWARGAFWGTIRIFSVDLTIQGLEELEDTTPAIVFSRHASTLDTMLPIAVVRELKYFRYVIKSELLTDPALDYCAQRFPNVFVQRGSKDPEFEIEKVIALGKELKPNDAVVIYPEGTRFTPEKRARLVEKFADDEEMGPIVERLENTLPPLREGGVRLVEETPDADLVFIAHRGVDDVSAMSDLVKGHMTDATMEVRIWRIPASQVPRSEDGIRDFLVDNWERIDHFIAEGYEREKESETVAA